MASGKKDYSKAYRLRHPERVKAMRRKYQRGYTLKHKFGITVEEYSRLLAAQGGKCAICKHKPEGDDRYRTGKNLAVDHCHRTGKVRGLLCDRCNRGLGHFRDDVEYLLQAVLYLQKW